MNKIKALILFLLLTLNLFSQEQFKLISLFDSNPINSLVSSEETLNLIPQMKSFMSLNLSYEKIRPSINLNDTSTYTGISFQEKSFYLKSISFYFGTSKDGILLSTGLFFPQYDRDAILSSVEENETVNYRETIDSSPSSRYVQIYLKYSLSNTLTLGAGYGRVFGEQTKSEEFFKEDELQSFYYTKDKIKGFYFVFSMNAKVSSWLKLTGIFTTDISGTYTNYSYYSSSEEGELTEYALSYRMPKLLRADLFIKKSNIYFSFLFYSRNHSISQNSENSYFYAIDSSKSHIMELGWNLKTRYSILPFISLNFKKYRYWITDESSKQPRIYSFGGAFYFNLEKFLLKFEYYYLYSKANYTVYTVSADTRLYYDRFIFSLVFPIL